MTIFYTEFVFWKDKFPFKTFYTELVFSNDKFYSKFKIFVILELLFMIRVFKKYTTSIENLSRVTYTFGVPLHGHYLTTYMNSNN